ncbi:isopentenyl-diphosphate Delta-isomerase [Agromyces marinus]|uniref:Isopentenyl-diphosphate Delta-isomerase n=1 Tax=Agromyces marinus TaxID=1389020 RepID=A0ABM8GY01_9MICO|nr:isopentenyl-diphosphate Delta-isomerase [Agromyces marinus]UIP58404.1 Isopentenyl-diphosphate Delta-isomerase [Agromyces marinus]BDZ53341.1 isopentenyl-diphosphate Delta-isomerase [Agromyces marinus]
MDRTMNGLEDEVVLLDESGTPIGRAPKSAAHGPSTELHLAFSCHVVNPIGEVLVTRRAVTKQTWPGVWTNSFCGHPRPAEPLLHAVRRRADHELGLELTGIDLALPLFRYRATDAAGIVENEVCPVYVATASAEPDPNPREVAEYRWVRPEQFAAAIRATPWAFSPWLVLQAEELELFRA